MVELKSQLDPAWMGAAISGCPDQITHILASGAKWTHPYSDFKPFQVLFLGMGGSAIGGDVVRVWAEHYGSVPMIVNRDYRIPNWINEQTLVIASSYSGNTEETLSSVAMAAERGATIVVITSGGKLQALADQHKWGVFPIPDGLQPRAAIGYSITAVSLVMRAFSLLPGSILKDLEQGAMHMKQAGRSWHPEHTDDNAALTYAQALVGKLPVIYGSAGTTEVLALRFRGQLAENSKQFACHHNLPEQNHNEIEGLANRIAENDDVCVAWLTDVDDHQRLELRRNIITELMGTGAKEIVLAGVGENLIQRNLHLLHLIDWISYYVALLRNQDPSNIEKLLEPIPYWKIIKMKTAPCS